MAKIKFKIITPERQVVDVEADSITCPTQTGQITILPNHIPLISALASGELLVRTGSTTDRLAVSGGFVEVRPGNEVIILADAAHRAEDINIAAVTEARNRAEALLKNKATLSEEEYAAVLTDIERSTAMIMVSNRHRGHHGGSSEGVMHE